jgi:hypothetical protein
MIMLLAVFRPAPASGQRGPDPYQLVTIGAGAGFSRALGELPEGERADDGLLGHYSLAFEILQGGVYGYLRGNVDLGQVRGRTSLTLGARPRLPVIADQIRPYVSVGLGILWLQPSRIYEHVLERELPARGEVAVGLDWAPVRAFFGFFEYQLGASRHYPVTFVADPFTCPGTGRCAVPGPERLLHLTHGFWVGGRFQIF